MKKYFSGLISGLLIALSITVFANSPIQNALFIDTVKLKVNGQEKPITFVNVDGNNYGKVRDIIDAVGGTVQWDDATSTISVSTTAPTQILPPTPSVIPQPTPRGGNQVEVKGYKMKSNIVVIEEEELYIIDKGEGYIPISSLGAGKQLEIDQGTIKFNIPNRPQIVSQRSNIGKDGITAMYEDRVCVKLSALGLKATINGDTLTIE